MSDSASPSATFADSANFHSALRSALMVSIDSTFAPSDIASPLFQIILDQRRFLSEELHVLMRRFEKIGHALGRLVEGLREFLLFLIAPSGFEVVHLGMQSGQQCLQFVV